MVALSRTEAEIDITGISFDSRAVRPGDLFCCVPGSRVDGHRFAATAVAAGARALLVQHRVDRTSFAVAVFTNLSQDHLDYHTTMDAYFEAKALLFESGLSRQAVINADDRWGQRLLARRPDAAIYSGADAADLDLRA